MATLSPSLAKFRSEINAKWPNRDKSSDGWIGDPAHAARVSDHNPDSRDIVHAIDVDVTGIDKAAVIREALADPRTEYVISDRIIWTRSSGFTPRRYTGSNPHTSHIHISGRYGTAFENDTRPWFAANKPTPKPKPGGSAVAAVTISGTVPVLKYGMKDPIAFKGGNYVSRVQQLLGFQGKDVDGIYGPKTAAAVKAMNARLLRRTVDGRTVDAATWERLYGMQG